MFAYLFSDQCRTLNVAYRAVRAPYSTVLWHTNWVGVSYLKMQTVSLSHSTRCQVHYGRPRVCIFRYSMNILKTFCFSFYHSPKVYIARLKWVLLCNPNKIELCRAGTSQLFTRNKSRGGGGGQQKTTGHCF